MAKSMARIKNGIVVNIEWWHDEKNEADTLVNINDRLVNIGDDYKNGEFYRNGKKVFTYEEMLNSLLIDDKELEEANNELTIEG